MEFETILHFWFEEIKPAQWFTKDEQFDRQIVQRFGDVHRRAARCELFKWREHSRGRLAEIIVLDQFSRNMFRDSGRAFSFDPLALALAQEAVKRGVDQELPPVQRGFLYLPYMHSESPAIHEVAEQLYRQKGMESGLHWELKHRAIIDRFGRYPHRNASLGRISTDEEIDFLQQPGSSF